MITLKESWESYLKAVVPKDATESEIKAAHATFYAGAHCLAEILKVIGRLEQKHGRTKEARELVGAIEDELDEFVAMVTK